MLTFTGSPRAGLIDRPHRVSRIGKPIPANGAVLPGCGITEDIL